MHHDLSAKYVDECLVLMERLATPQMTDVTLGNAAYISKYMLLRWRLVRIGQVLATAHLPDFELSPVAHIAAKGEGQNQCHDRAQSVSNNKSCFH